MHQGVQGEAFREVAPVAMAALGPLFGDFPDDGASFIIGSKEIFQKSLTSLTINFEWQQVPNTGTTVNISSLAKGNWQSVNSDVSLYAASITIDSPVQPISRILSAVRNARLKFTPNILLSPTFEVTDLKMEEFVKEPAITRVSGIDFFPNIQLLPDVDTTALNSIVHSPPDFTANDAYSVTSVDGYIELELNGTAFNLATFLNVPPPSVTVNYDNSKPPNVTGYTVNKTPPPVAAPPALKSISITYSAEDNLLFTNTRAAFSARNGFYYHIEPFGFREMHPQITTDAPLTFLPIFNLDNGKPNTGSTNNDGGELWIGLGNALPDETFSILFQVSDGSANPLRNMTEVDWYYLSANNWTPFKAQTVTDYTNNLTSSGIVIVNVPADATLNNTRVDNNLIWIKAVVNHDTDAVCNLIAVDTNAAKAQFVQVPEKDIVFTNPLPPNTISKPAVADDNGKTYGALK